MIRKVLISLGVVLVLLIVCAGVYVNHMVSSMSVDRNADHVARVLYLWDNTSWGGDKLEATPDPELTHFFGRLQNPLMDKGPHLVAYPLDNTEVVPAVLVIPGGGYRFRSEELEGNKIARWLNDQGMAAFVLNYRLGKHPQPLNDARLAMSYLRAHHQALGLDASKLGVMGFSAGGHLAASLSNLHDRADLLGALPEPFAQESSRPDFVVLAYPVISFNPPYAHMGSRENLIGESPSESLIHLLSAEEQVRKDTPPTFIWAPKTDFVVDHQNSNLYAESLSAMGVENEVHIFPEGRHGSELAQDEEFASHWPELMLSWLRRQELIPVVPMR